MSGAMAPPATVSHVWYTYCKTQVQNPMTTPTSSPTVPALKTRHRFVVRLQNGVLLLGGVYDPSVHHVPQVVEFDYGSRRVTARYEAIRARLIWYQEVDPLPILQVA